MAQNEENTSRKDGDSKNNIENLEDYFKNWLNQNNDSMQKYYTQTLLRTRVLLILSIVTYAIAALFFFMDLYFFKKIVDAYLKNSPQDIAKYGQELLKVLENPGMMWALVVPVIIGVVLLLTACIVFREYKQTLQEMSVIYDRISANDKYALALKTVDKIQGSAGQELYKEIAESALKDAHKLYEGINEKY